MCCVRESAMMVPGRKMGTGECRFRQTALSCSTRDTSSCMPYSVVCLVSEIYSFKTRKDRFVYSCVNANETASVWYVSLTGKCFSYLKQKGHSFIFRFVMMQNSLPLIKRRSANETNLPFDNALLPARRDCLG